MSVEFGIWSLELLHSTLHTSHSTLKQWLDLLFETNYIDKAMYFSMKNDCEEMRKMMSATTKTMNVALNTPHSTLQTPHSNTKRGETE
jgi:patatin-like phospholipase/acyl hydrolase